MTGVPNKEAPMRTSNDRAKPLNDFKFADIAAVDEIVDINGRTGLNSLGQILFTGLQHQYSDLHPDSRYIPASFKRDLLGERVLQKLRKFSGTLIDTVVGIEHLSEPEDESISSTDPIVRFTVTTKLHRSGVGNIGDYTGTFSMKTSPLEQSVNRYTIQLVSEHERVNGVQEELNASKIQAVKSERSSVSRPLRGGAPGLVQQKK